MAGYSGTPLAKKLGIRSAALVSLLEEPEGFLDVLDELPPEVVVRRRLGRRASDVIVLFVRSAAELGRRLPAARGALATDGGLWIAWPKKASGVVTDLDEGVVRAAGLAAGLVDNKVCAIDETWSGLRFVWRVKDRAAVAASRAKAAERK